MPDVTTSTSRQIRYPPRWEALSINQQRNIYDDAPPEWQGTAALSIGRRGAYGERRITLLPGESAIKILFSPRGRFLLQIAKYIRDAMHWSETSQVWT